MKNKPISRRQFLRGSSLIGASVSATVGSNFATAIAGQSSLRVTPRQTEGPFYPITEQNDKDADLTRYGSSNIPARGEIISIKGQVLDDSNTPIAKAIVDVWQANAAGRYAHERDPNPAPLDPNFQGWAIIKTDDLGRFQFKTIRPGAYPISRSWTRTPHIHFKVSSRGYQEITTQMYFDDEPLNDADRLLNQLPKEVQSTLIAKRENKTEPFEFNVVLARV